MNYEQDSLTQWHFRHDALEAFNSFSAARNLFFWITIAGLAIVQLVFWGVDRGAINSGVGGPDAESIEIRNTIPGGSINTQTYPEGFILCSYDPYYSFCQEVVAPKKADEATEASPEKVEPLKPVDEPEKASTSFSFVDSGTIRNILEITKVIVIFSVILYCVCMFLCIQLSLTGSLGGMAASSKAFFTALLATLLILPIQQKMTSCLPGVLMSFDDIVLANSTKAESPIILYYIQSHLMWVAAFLLIVVSQWTSCKAVKQITARAKEWKSVNPIAPQQIVPNQAASIPLAAQTGAPIPVQPTQQPPQNPRDNGYDSNPIPVE